MEHGNVSGGYSKYFPNETKLDFKPDTSEEFRVTINSHGFRGRDFAVEKPPNTLRVLTLGASSTFGYHDKDEETYPYLLEQRLNRNAGPERFEVINLGMPHLHSWEIRALFEREGLPLKPDVVTFYEGINDSAAEPKPIEEPSTSRAARNPRKAGRVLPRPRNLPLVARARDLGRARRFVPRSERAVWSYDLAAVTAHQVGKSERFVENVAAIHELCRQNGALLIVVTQQAKSTIVPDVRGLTYQEEISVVRNRLERGERIPLAAMAFLTHERLSRISLRWAGANDVPVVDAIRLLDARRDYLWTWAASASRGERGDRRRAGRQDPRARRAGRAPMRQLKVVSKSAAPCDEGGAERRELLFRFECVPVRLRLRKRHAERET